MVCFAVVDFTTLHNVRQRLDRCRRLQAVYGGSIGSPTKTDTLARLYDGKLRLERRNGAPKIYASTYLQGKNVVKTSGEITLSGRHKVATDWYLELRDRVRKGEQLHGALVRRHGGTRLSAGSTKSEGLRRAA